MTLAFSNTSNKDRSVIDLYVVEPHTLDQFLETSPLMIKKWVASNGFKANLGEILVVPDSKGGIECVLAGWGTAAVRSRGNFHMGKIIHLLPQGEYSIKSDFDLITLEQAHLAWFMAQYQFDKYKSSMKVRAQLRPSPEINIDRLLAIVEGDFLTRDLINTPTNDMHPEKLEMCFRKLAADHGAKVNSIIGDDLLEQNFPMIHAVGRASAFAPRLLDMTWGDRNDPKITLVGKGVCFDTGGLNIKPASSMGLMKKDMGGAATVMGLAHMIMRLRLKIRLRVLVPAVENSISSNAFRPQDILTSRKGYTVEINHTDAEGRLVLADALAYADEEIPDLMICNATLTGAARVALGPDIPPFYTRDEILASEIAYHADKQSDPLWRMPLWDPYENMIEPDIADLDNAPQTGFAGSITAALFLHRFVEQTGRFVHFDLYGWNPANKPAFTKGGMCQSARAMLGVIESLYAS